MRIIISPAKKMIEDTDSLDYRSLPYFLREAEVLKERLAGMSFTELKSLWRCNDRLAELNRHRLATMNLRRNLTPAILSFQGLQFQHMGAGVFESSHYEYIEERLRILSGFYGVLRPFDGVVPYRLEMQSKLSIGEHRDLYEFWGNKIALHLSAETDLVLNLASDEYSKAVKSLLPPEVKWIDYIFGEEQAGRVLQKGTYCKMARGEMIRFMAENQIEDPRDTQAFDRQGYRFSASHSDADLFVFLRPGKQAGLGHG